MTAIVDDILRDQAAYEAQRANFDNTWQRIADLIYPAGAQIVQKNTEGQRRDQAQFDSTGALALSRFQAAMESVLTPRTQRWHGLAPSDSALAELDDVKAYCEAVTELLFKARYNSRSNFTGACGEHYLSLGAFGNGVTFVDEVPGKHLRYKSLFMGEVWFAANAHGLIDTTHRKFELTARQAVQKFADQLPPEITNAATTSPQRIYEFIHCVKPRADYDPGRRDYRGMPISSYYICTTASRLIEESGFWSMPYICSRFQTAPRETYGRGPASQVLPTLNTANEMQKTLLRAGQKAVDPPLMMPDDDILATFNLRAGALNAGAIDSQGRALVQPLATGANLPIGLDMIQSEREVINQAFYVTLFQILVDNPQMTATEAMLRAQEKGALLAPAMGPQQTEYLSPIIERELDILSRAGQLPPMPQELMDAGGIVTVEFTSPLNRMQRAEDGVAILRTFEALTPLAQIDPSVFDTFHLPRTARVLADLNGMPVKCFKTDDEQDADDAAKQQQADAAQLLAAAPVAGKAAYDLTRAAQTAQSVPQLGAMLNSP